jgi:G3E family GTPase
LTTPVVLVSGLHTHARTTAVNRLLAAHPGAVAVHHDLSASTGGTAERVVRDHHAVLNRVRVKLAHGCGVQPILEDLIIQLIRRAHDASLLIADLWDSTDPRPVAEAVDRPGARGVLRLAGVLTAVDAEHLPVDICRGDRIREPSTATTNGDARHYAEVLIHQVEYATGLMLHGGDADDEELCRAVLDHLAPLTPIFRTDAASHIVPGNTLRAADLAARVDPATARYPCEAQTGHVTTVVWRRIRPLHPGRLFHAAEELVTGSIRSRGRFWLATRPDRLLAWDSVAGAVFIEDTGPWLAALPQDSWETVSLERRAAASLDWHPLTGDRMQHLVFTGPGLDRDRIHAVLDSCLLTPQETKSGPANWTAYHDPFAPSPEPEETA